MENYYINNDNNMVENPCLTPSEGKKRVRRGEEEAKKRLRRVREEAWHAESRVKAGLKQGIRLKVLRVAVVLGMMIFVSSAAWGQTGIWYIANSNNNSGQGYIPPVYNVGTPETNWYLVPAANPQQLPSCIDAYYSPNHNTTNGDSEKPFLTTYKTNKDFNSVWVVAESGEANYYFIIHVPSGKYVIHEPPLPNDNARRKAMHLQTIDDGDYNPETNSYFKFKITTDGTGLKIEPKNRAGYYWNPAGQNSENYYGTGNTYFHNGLVGLYNVAGANSTWYFEDATLIAPNISDVSASNTITITDAVGLPAGYTIRYTTGDGSQAAPTATTGTEYSGPITVMDSWTVKAVVVRYGLVLTAVATKSVEPVVVAPTVTNNYDGTISLSTPTPNAEMYYTLDGTEPSNSNGTQYSSAFSLGNATVVKAVTLFGSVYSDVTTYNVPQYTEPTISFNSATSLVTIDPGSGGTAYYNTGNGSQADPTTSSTEYTAPFTVSSATTVKAIATHLGYLTSTVATLPITQVATPTIQNNGSNAVSITCATSGATIYYAIGSSPVVGTSPTYTTPLTEGVSGQTIYAIAVKENMLNSAVGSGTVTLQCAAPVITRNGNTGFTATCAFPATGVTIYYTTDGSTTPTTSTPTHINSGESVAIDLPVTVKAIAVATNYNNSTVTTATVSDGMGGSGTEADPYTIEYQSDVDDFVSKANTASEASKYYKVIATTPLDFSSADEITQPFSGNFDGNLQTLSLSHALFNTVDGGVVKNVMLKGVAISSAADTVGAITNIAKGYTRIYNCGILPNDNTFPAGTHPSVSTSGACAGGLVGSLRDDSRVVNCFSYADVQASNLAAGIVGRNTFASDASETDGKYANLRTMVVNCMFYGNITASSVYPVYGGLKISNTGADAINNYNFYSVGCTFTSFTDYNCSWPAQIDYLTRYEFHRNLLNSNRELCGWWVGAATAPSTMLTAEVQAVPKDASLMAKWVLDLAVAPYPILKSFGKYSSHVNIDADADWRISANKWEGKKLGTLNVSVNPGSQHTASNVPLTLTITDMDTIHGDYCYRKVQLPYYNTVFGNPNGATWAEKYGDNYGDYVVIGWKVSTTEGTVGTLTEDWQIGYNFADRNCTAKDANRVFAQGGYYYVPNGVNNITITAQWATAIYLDNGADHSYDRVNFADLSNPTAGTHFAPAGTRPTTLSNGKTAVVTGNIKDNLPTSSSVYDNAIVLVGNHQYRVGGNNIGGSNNACTIMSADFDFDDEPDYSLIWQLGQTYTRQSFCPIRFDFLPVMELGMAMKIDGSTQLFALGCYRPLGHFEVTETSLIHFGQFEFGNKSRTIDAPLILNGGIFDQYCKGTEAYADPNKDHITYIILGGNVKMPSFTPGAHVRETANHPTRHCAVNIIGGTIDNVFLTGNYNNGVTPNKDNPHCYIDGGRIKQVAAAGKEGIDGNVYFKINHAKIWEFYGGSTLADKRVTGSIDVTIDSSIVTKYCGGPKFGDMYYENDKTITTHATGTTFTFYYGGGNGGTSYVQHGTQQDNTTTATGYNWNATGTNQGHVNEYVPRAYINEETGYRANYDMEIVNVSTGTEAGKAVFRTYFYAAQFSATNTGPISNTLTGCKVLKNFYGAGNLGGVYGDVTSELTDTEVDSLAFGAGFSASIPQVTIYNKDKTPPTIDINTGIITPQLEGTSTTYTWCYENTTTGVVVPEGVTIPAGVGTGNPAFTSGGKNYFYTTVSLEGLGTVRGDVTLTLKGNSKVGTQGHADTGNVYGGGDESAVDKNASDEKGNTTVKLQGNTHVGGNVYGGGNNGSVGGNSEVIIQDD